MRWLVELSNFPVEAVNSKCTTPSETEGEVEVTPKMYEQCIGKVFKLDFST